jgi:hypothetical protein
MESRTEDMTAPEFVTPTTKTLCNEGCIVLYTHDDCVFCSQMKQLVFAVLDKYHLSRDILVEMDMDETCLDFTQFPTVRLCDVTVTGIQPFDRLDAGLMELLLKPCFCESKNLSTSGLDEILLVSQDRK